ncbi:LysR family transcriptional regulator [Zwartia vadi]|uniref:LysR family transcriptional regulator n=1 Tax=Zwartia vadi TaxID=3058168 RepID=UPI0025B376DC|nr:LysR family transcriptional regulator [Zwartia vadi]MDN3986306.1 LysR family transcriptional regulator [Zwartia vadi]
MNNLKALRYFVAVVDAGSITAAANVVAIAQPALTRQIRELEEDFGTLLLQRLPRGVCMTAAGVTLYESAQRILAEADRVSLNLREGLHRTTSVSLGVPPTLGRVLLPGLFESCLQLPGARPMRAREAFTPALLEWLGRGIIDMAIVTNPPPGRKFLLRPLINEPFALISPNRKGQAQTIQIDQVAQLPVLMTSLHHGIVDQQLRALNLNLKIEGIIDSVDAIRELVLRRGHSTIMPVSVFKDDLENSTIQISQIAGVQLSRTLVLAQRRDRDKKIDYDMVEQLIDSEFSRLERLGAFGLHGIRL